MPINVSPSVIIQHFERPFFILWGHRWYSPNSISRVSKSTCYKWLWVCFSVELLTNIGSGGWPVFGHHSQVLLCHLSLVVFQAPFPMHNTYTGDFSNQNSTIYERFSASWCTMPGTKWAKNSGKIYRKGERKRLYWRARFHLKWELLQRHSADTVREMGNACTSCTSSSTCQLTWVIMVTWYSIWMCMDMQ